MTRYAVLLRGVNVGGHRRVPMARLRQVMTAAGLENAATLLASGNLLVSSEGEASHVKSVAESALADAFGFSVDTVVFTQEALLHAVEACPFPDTSPVAIAFCSGRIDHDAHTRLLALAVPDEDVAVMGEFAYLRLGRGQSSSKLAAGVSRALVPLVTTVRNLATSTKLAHA